MRAASRRPAVPYLGLYLTDLTFIEDGNKDWVAEEGGERLVNLSKCAMLGKALGEILRFQRSDYASIGIEPNEARPHTSRSPLRSSLRSPL